MFAIAGKNRLTQLMVWRSVALALSLLLCAAGFLAGCTPLENNARDVAAAAQGFIIRAQTLHQAECAANPNLQVCGIINQAIGAQNLLIDSIESYCGWPARPTPAQLSSVTASCQRIKTFQAGLQTAVTNLDSTMSDLKIAAGVTK